MSAFDKLAERFRECPTDFTWNEMVRLLGGLGYEERRGKGSRRKFRGEGLPAINLHEPLRGRS